MMTGQTSQTDPANCLDPYKALSFQLFNDAGEETSHLPVAVKSLTTAGVILEILHQDNGLKFESLKGRDGLFTVITQNDCVKIEVPGKILWTRNREGDSGITLGLELLEPLPLPVRHILEANMSIGAKDMKVLWDYWDEIQESAGSAETAGPVALPIFVRENPAVSDCEGEPVGNGNWLYWLGFGAIICGIALQFSPSEQLGFSGLIVIFLGSLMVAWKSVISMWQISSSGAGN